MDKYNIKLGSITPDSILRDVSIKKYPTLAQRYDNTDYYHETYTGGNGYYKGLMVCPYVFDAAEKNRLFIYPWDYADPDNKCNDTAAGYNHWGYIRSYYTFLNITQHFKSTISTSAPYGLNNLWGLAFTFWCKKDKFNANGEIDFGDRPIVIEMHCDNLDDGTWDVPENNICTVLDGVITVNKIKPKSWDDWYAPVMCIWKPNVQSNSKAAVEAAMLNLYVKIHNIEFHTDEITDFCDPSSCEAYKAYLGDIEVWDKERTFANCWEKYGIIEFFSLRIYFRNDESSYRFITPAKAAFDSSKTATLSLSQKTSSGQYTSISWPAIEIKVTVLSGNVNITWERLIQNGQPGPGESLPQLQGSKSFSTGTDTITIPAGRVVELRKIDPSSPIVTNEMKNLSISTGANTKAVIEFVNNSNGINVIGYERTHDRGQYYVNVPTISDYNGTTIINTRLYNEEMWDNIKDWYLQNTVNANVFKSGYLFSYSDLEGEITINLPANDSFLYSSHSFVNCAINTINFVKGNSSSRISSLNGMFSGASLLSLINVTLAEQDDKPYVCGPVDITSAFEYCFDLLTYPANFFNWSINRGNQYFIGESCTLCNGAFLYTGLTNIPAYNPDNLTDTDFDENTLIFPNFAEYTFAGSTALSTIGPILDFGLLQPERATEIFLNCDSLTDVRIKNLNHGNWYFNRNGENYHGNLKNLNTNSVEYLFNNVSDLHDYQSGYQYEQNVRNSFLTWESYYRGQIEKTVYWDYNIVNNYQIQCKTRFSTLDPYDPPQWIIYTTDNTGDFDSTLMINGLLNGDVLHWIDDGNDTLITNLSLDQDSKISNLHHTSGKRTGIILTGTDTGTVTITLENGINLRIPRTDSATIYCPIEWEDLDVSGTACQHAISCGWSLKVIDNGTERDFDYEFNTPEYVDFDLPSGTLWAKYDVGNTANDNNSPLFSWGNTEGHLKNSSYAFTQANYDNTPGSLITRSTIPKENDAAHATYGGKWRVASQNQFLELIGNTTYSNYKFSKRDDPNTYIVFNQTAFKIDNTVRDFGNPINHTATGFDSTSDFCFDIISGTPKVVDRNYKCYGIAMRATKIKSQR